MDDIDEVLARIGQDPTFRTAMQADARSTLDPWDLSADDLTRVQAELDRIEPSGERDAVPSVRSLLGGDPTEED